MRNIVFIKNELLYQIEIGSGQDSVVISMIGVSASDCYVEIYKGDEFYTCITCTIGGGVATAEIPIDIFTGSNIHFRFMCDGTPTQFYHIITDVSKDLMLTMKNYVVAANDAMGAVVLNNNAFGSYAYLSLATYGELEVYTYDDLGGGAVEV